MTTVGMNYQVHKGKEKAFEKKFALVQAAMKGIPGHLSTQLYRNAYQECSYLVISEWEGREAFDVFVSSEQFRAVTAWGEAHILATRPKHIVYGDESRAPIPGGCSHMATAQAPHAAA